MLQQTLHVHSHLPTTLHGTPQQIEGPYFVDGMPNRSDVASGTSNGSVEQGIPLRLVIHVYGVNNDSCVPLKGAKLDIWHANSQGIYSAVKDMGTAENNFLRGYQVTDNNGTVEFTTIYPRWYEGRAIHIHDKVRIFNGSEKALEWTAQLYLNNSINEQVHEQTPYNSHGPIQTTNEEDMIYTGASADGLIQKKQRRTVDGQPHKTRSFLSWNIQYCSKLRPVGQKLIKILNSDHR